MGGLGLAPSESDIRASALCGYAMPHVRSSAARKRRLYRRRYWVPMVETLPAPKRAKLVEVPTEPTSSSSANDPVMTRSACIALFDPILKYQMELVTAGIHNTAMQLNSVIEAVAIQVQHVRAETKSLQRALDQQRIVQPAFEGTSPLIPERGSAKTHASDSASNHLELLNRLLQEPTGLPLRHCLHHLYHPCWRSPLLGKGFCRLGPESKWWT